MRWQPRIHVPFLAAVLTLGGLHGCSTADSPAAREQSREDEARESDAAKTVPPGTSLVFSVDQMISTATHARGDVFSATLRHRVTDVAGGEAIPEGVPSQWIVTEATTEDGSTVLAVRLESIRVNGSWTPLVGDVTEAHLRTASTASKDASAPGADVPADVAAEAANEVATDVAIGYAATEALESVVGEDGMTAGTAGADAGTLVTLTTRGGSATLPAGSAITVQLSEPLEV